MRSTKQANKEHYKCLAIAAKFDKEVGITKAPDDYKCVEWKAPKPRRMVIPNQKRI